MPPTGRGVEARGELVSGTGLKKSHLMQVKRILT
jgi:hypothetical protein